MKKQKIQIVIMLVLVLLCALGYFLLNRYAQKKEEAEQAEAEAATTTVCEIAAEDITGFSYQIDGVTYAYQKSGDEWTCEGYEELDLDEDQITALLANVTVVTCDEVLTDVEDYDSFGFAEPSNVITVTTDEKTITITIGDYNSTASCYYYMTSESDDVYAGNAAVCTSFILTPDNYEAIVEDETVSENTTN
jgi:hypothetical protein